MNECKHCGTNDNIVYSGVDAFLLGCTTENICYPCANVEMVSR